MCRLLEWSQTPKSDEIPRSSDAPILLGDCSLEGGVLGRVGRGVGEVRHEGNPPGLEALGTGVTGQGWAERMKRKPPQQGLPQVRGLGGGVPSPAWWVGALGASPLSGEWYL